MDDDDHEVPDMYSKTLSYSIASMQAQFGFKIARMSWRAEGEDPLHPKKYVFYIHRDMIRIPDLRLFSSDQVETKISLPGILVMKSPVIKDAIYYTPTLKDIQAKDWYILEASHQLYHRRRSNGESH